MFHEWPTATTYMAVLPGVLGCRPLRLPFRYASGSIPRYRGTVVRWHAHLRGLVTAIHETSGLVLPRTKAMTELVKVLKVGKFSDQGERITTHWRILCNLT